MYQSLTKPEIQNKMRIAKTDRYCNQCFKLFFNLSDASDMFFCPLQACKEEKQGTNVTINKLQLVTLKIFSRPRRK